MNNVILIGYRGTGKSSVADLVAQATGRDAFHMDAAIQERAGCTIPDFVAQHGWDAFRDLESEICVEAARFDNTVIDTGGGVVLRESNMSALRAGGPVVWLTATVETIRARIGGDTQRPSLTGQKSFVDEVAEVLARREPLYSRYADAVVATDRRTPADIADEIIAFTRNLRKTFP